MDTNITFTDQEFKILAQLLDNGVRATGINVAAGGEDFISAMKKFFALKPEENKSEEK